MWHLWAVVIIAVVVWVLSNLLRGASEDQRRKRDRPGGEREGRRPRVATDLDRFLDEARRRRVAGPEAKPPVARAVEVSEARPVPRRPIRPPVAPPPPKVIIRDVVPAARPVLARPALSARLAAPAEPILEVIPVASTAAARRPEAPPAPATVVTRPQAVVPPALRQVVSLLRSSQGLRTAVVLNQVFGPPLCRRGQAPRGSTL